MKHKYKVGDYVVYESQEGSKFIKRYSKVIELYTQPVHSGKKINNLYLIDNKLIHENSIIRPPKIGAKVWCIQWTGGYFGIFNKKILFKEEDFVRFSPKRKLLSFLDIGFGVPDIATYDNLFSTKKEAKQAYIDKGYKKKDDIYYNLIQTIVKDYYMTHKKLK